MSPERELLKEIWDELDGERDTYQHLVLKIEEELAKPEKQPSAWLFDFLEKDQLSNCYPTELPRFFEPKNIRPLYLSENRKPPLADDANEKLTDYILEPESKVEEIKKPAKKGIRVIAFSNAGGWEAIENFGLSSKHNATLYLDESDSE